MNRINKIAAALAVAICVSLLAGCSTQKSVPSSAKVSSNALSSSAAKKGDPNKKAILVVSFGTSYNDTREKTIGAIEKEIAAAYPDYTVRRAFTSQTIIDKLAKRDNLKIDNIEGAMKRLASDGYGTVICQPTHVMNGIEYDEMVTQVNEFKNQFSAIKFGHPLISSVQDYQNIVAALSKEFSNVSSRDALVFVGHGTDHFANATYAALDYRFKNDGHSNVFVGTVESYPDMPTVLKQIQSFGAKKVYIVPLMIVAGDHANNDIIGDQQGSWKTEFKKQGFIVEGVLKGLGEYKSIRDIFVAHVKETIAKK